MYSLQSQLLPYNTPKPFALIPVPDSVLSVIVPFVCVPVNTLNPTSGFASGLISVISFCEQPAMARAESANHTCFVFIFL